MPGKQAALDLLAEAVLAAIPEPAPGPWESQLLERYSAARQVLLEVPGIAMVLQTNGNNQVAREHDRLSRSLARAAGLDADQTSAAHALLYTFLLGSVSLENSRTTPIGPTFKRSSSRQSDARFKQGLQMIIAGIRATAA